MSALLSLLSRVRDPGAGTPRRCAAPGFTLVELLIALAMVALITLLLFSGLRVGTRAWDLVDATAERVGAVRLAEGFLVRALTQARPVSLTFDGALVPVFAGDVRRVEFAAPLSEHVGVPGLYVLRLEVEGAGRRGDLILTRWLMHPEVLEGKLDGVPKWEPLKNDSRALAGVPLDQDAAAGAFGRTLLLEGMDGLVINYYGVLAGESDPDWHQEWLEQPRPPDLIRIHLTTVNQTWPDLIVALPSPRA
ncbi:prepilin-type N-terminal cleavage/methylation domain-containing protein [uncultured Thiodictyon sp.]|uniref:prepilin-type N-terminal cleavage/methylation domain-containing protein n=1 Tax=uncultured Thiodictyon sp. TaxID=1846217 RepID=UPI0025D9A3A9|nr:prepilin-type N-terminal cleavage/methylation domain-containing protein [uncultured Thiodictyon sp.]